MFYCAVCHVTDVAILVALDLGPIMYTLTRSCDNFLSYLHLSTCPPETNFIEYYSTDKSCFGCWDDMVHLLDLAVLIYAGAHVGPLPEEIISVAKPFQRFSRIKLRAWPLRCLNLLLGNKPALIFYSQTIDPVGEIYISASADVFANIWGPMWRVYSESDRSILHYNVGSGSIIPWEFETGHHPQLKDNERLGHWMKLSSTFSDSHTSEEVNPWLRTRSCSEGGQSEDHDSSESEPEEEAENLDINAQSSRRRHAYAMAHPFSGSERILIGAQKNPKLVWSKCSCSIHKLTHRMKERQHIHFLKTSKLFHYVDAKNLSMVAGGHGLTLGGSITMKTQNGRSWKEGLLEVWENQPDARHPRDLESFWGVTISLCTFNARRVRLTELLGTDSIKYLLHPFRWSGSHIESEFFNAVSSSKPFALRALWIREEKWQEELGKALLTCLRALCQTGYDANRKELNALWMSPKSTGPKRVVLEPLDHSWVKMLQDSEDSFATAVMVKKCLGITSAKDGPQSCIQEGGWHAPSRLETAIAITEKFRTLHWHKQRCVRKISTCGVQQIIHGKHDGMSPTSTRVKPSGEHALGHG
ncbi:hypothetical protein MMC29_004589 [Sticta canariensis]|nr:hypothetical protein [Sticta canariensis]